MVVVVFLLAVSLLYSFNAQLRCICLTDEDLIIRKQVGKIVIPRKERLLVRRKEEMIRDVRLFGIADMPVILPDNESFPGLLRYICHG